MKKLSIITSRDLFEYDEIHHQWFIDETKIIVKYLHPQPTYHIKSEVAVFPMCNIIYYCLTEVEE